MSAETGPAGSRSSGPKAVDPDTTRKQDRDGGMSPAEFTRRMPDNPEEGAGEGAPETIEPVQGREDDGPAGPPQRKIGSDEGED